MVEARLAARALAATRKPVEGSMLKAVALLPPIKVRAPSRRGGDPRGAPTGTAALGPGAPAEHSQHDSGWDSMTQDGTA